MAALPNTTPGDAPAVTVPVWPLGLHSRAEAEHLVETLIDRLNALDGDCDHEADEQDDDGWLA